jgi:NADH:ubiquinone oxidoreductase subunit 2 (subunit N)
MVVFILAAVAAGASMGGRAFRLYSFVSLVVMLGFGVLTSVLAPALASDDPTPWFGLTERIDIGAFLLWVIVLALSLLRTAPRRHAPPRQPNPRVLSGHAARRTVQP